MKYWVIAVSVILLVGYASECGTADVRKGEGQVIDQEVMDLMRKLDTLDDRSRMKLISQVDEQRNELLGVLLRQLGTSQSKNVQAAAIYMIGRHRLSGGVRDLIQRIDFEAAWQSPTKSLPLWERYPAMEALITIGLPSVPPAVELLASDTNDLRRELAVKVIRQVEGPDVSVFILERAYANEGDANRKAMLKEALSRLHKLIQETA